mmetsp:Transcript_46516/g.124929  ORF Transcript_46516/g.124929 Transcript_46516/m.124929 type:complete len:409 (-) Transcript_46516:30-1256(-)
MALLRLLVLGTVATRSVGLRQPATCGLTDSESSSFIQVQAAVQLGPGVTTSKAAEVEAAARWGDYPTMPPPQTSSEPDDLPNKQEQTRMFSHRDTALSRMLYSFYMIASCTDMFTPYQVNNSKCLHCEAASFDYRPGELQIVDVKDISAVVVRLRPSPSVSNAQEGCAVAFRGTQTAWNVVSDLLIQKEQLPNCTGCWVHSGWYAQWWSLRWRIVRALSDLGCQGQPLYLTGHSSGCAVSDYAAFDLHDSFGYKIATSIGYNCPKPGQKEFAKAFDKMFPDDVWKVQIDFDPVRHMPPKFTGYEGVGWAVQYRHGEGEGFHVCGKGNALCEGDHTPRLTDDIAEKISSYHCAAPHPDTFGNDLYMSCYARCDANLLAPEWGLAPAPNESAAAMHLQPGHDESAQVFRR